MTSETRKPDWQSQSGFHLTGLCLLDSGGRQLGGAGCEGTLLKARAVGDRVLDLTFCALRFGRFGCSNLRALYVLHRDKLCGIVFGKTVATLARRCADAKCV